MSCGCTKFSDFPSRLRVAACHLCPHAETGYRQTVIGCTLNGQSIIERMAGGDCPVNRVGADGNVQWAGVEWVGLPMVHRVWLWAFHPSHPAIGSWPGCGCVKVVKDFFKGIFNGSRHDIRPG